MKWTLAYAASVHLFPSFPCQYGNLPCILEPIPIRTSSNCDRTGRLYATTIPNQATSPQSWMKPELTGCQLNSSMVNMFGDRELHTLAANGRL